MRTVLVILSVMLSLSAYSDTEIRENQEIQMMTGYLPPFAYTASPKLFAQDEEIQGELIDRLRDVCQSAKVPCAFTMRHPWKLAVSGNKREKYSALFPVIRNATNEDMFQWVGPLKQQERLVVVALKNSPVMLRNLNALSGFKAGIRESLENLVEVPSSVHVTASDHLLWKELRKGDLDMWVVEESVARHYSRESKIELRTLLAITEVDLWLAVSKEVSNKYVMKLNAELRKTSAPAKNE